MEELIRETLYENNKIARPIWNEMVKDSPEKQIHHMRDLDVFCKDNHIGIFDFALLINHSMFDIQESNYFIYDKEKEMIISFYYLDQRHSYNPFDLDLLVDFVKNNWSIYKNRF